MATDTFVLHVYATTCWQRCVSHVRNQRRGGGLDRLGKLQKLRGRSNTGPDPLEMHKSTKPTFNVGSSLAR